MNTLKSMPAKFVGERLRLAREETGLTQQLAADKIDVARTTLIAVEQGQRRVRFAELQGLVELYGTSVNAVLRQEAVHVDLASRFRKLPNASVQGAVEAVSILSHLAKAEVELEILLGIKRVRNYPPERPILVGNVREQAEHDALELRLRHGLGCAPITDIATMLEMEMGVRVYVRRINKKIAGLFAYAEELGPCMLLNANHPREQRTLTAAHECAHLVATRGTPAILLSDETTSTREERYADAFASAFLIPSRTVKMRFQELGSGADKITRRFVVVFAHTYGVSSEAMVRRFEKLRLIKSGSWDRIASRGGISDRFTNDVIGDLASTDVGIADADRPTTLRLNLMAAEAYRRKLLSEGQLAELLRLDRNELREIVDDIELES